MWLRRLGRSDEANGRCGDVRCRIEAAGHRLAECLATHCAAVVGCGTGSVDGGSGATPTETHGFRFSYEAGILFIRLLSGRRLAYVKPRIEPNRFGGDSITYEGIGTGRKWERLETYSGKLVENIVQATARDLLFYSMQTLSQYFIVGHIHDEMIIECPKDTKLEELCQEMARTPDWAKGLLLRADGYACQFYKKD